LVAGLMFNILFVGILIGRTFIVNNRPIMGETQNTINNDFWGKRIVAKKGDTGTICF